MSGGSRGVRRWLAVAGALSLAPILALLAFQVGNAATTAPAGPVDSILRLHDLQIGYLGALECAAPQRAEADAALAVLPLLVARVDDEHAAEEVAPAEPIVRGPRPRTPIAPR